MADSQADADAWCEVLRSNIGEGELWCTFAKTCTFGLNSGGGAACRNRCFHIANRRCCRTTRVRRETAAQSRRRARGDREKGTLADQCSALGELSVLMIYLQIEKAKERDAKGGGQRGRALQGRDRRHSQAVRCAGAARQRHDGARRALFGAHRQAASHRHGD
jgi:hypothetical protein